MKKRHILTALLTALLLALAVSAGAQAAEVRPIPVDHDLVDLGNGEFCLTIMNADRIEKNGFSSIRNTDASMKIAAEGAAAMGMYPYYLYRQKNMSGNFENVGYAKEGKAGIYNILINIH